MAAHGLSRPGTGRAAVAAAGVACAGPPAAEPPGAAGAALVGVAVAGGGGAAGRAGTEPHEAAAHSATPALHAAAVLDPLDRRRGMRAVSRGAPAMSTRRAAEAGS
ncbi:MAG: hypothetical protein D6689_12280 [Deltaproteobacteria bacterium]|nr:MAG: hypothetical protein D6689_12280 [Deltaproteobacteria bacterium]